MLTIGSNGSLHLNGEHVSLPIEQMREFLLANISEPCALEDVKMKDLMNVMFHSQDFIRDYFLEEYHTVSALVSTMKPIQRIERVEFYKEMLIDGDGFLSIIPKVNVVIGDVGSDSLKEAKVVLVEKMRVTDFTNSFNEKGLWSKFSLLEVMDCAFSELGHTLSSGLAESAQIWSL